MDLLDQLNRTNFFYCTESHSDVCFQSEEFNFVCLKSMRSIDTVSVLSTVNDSQSQRFS